MKLSGHTNGTYGYTTEEAFDLFVEMGFDGVDIGCNDLSGITVETDEKRRREIVSYARDKGLVISNLACYAGGNAGITAEDASVREETIRQVKAHILLARDLDCERLRVFSGLDTGRGIAEGERGFAYAVQAVQAWSAYAEDFGVRLLVENHPSTITCTAQETVDLVQAVDRENVRILYDPSNLIVYAGDHDVAGNFELQKDYIAYVHMKDQVVSERGTYADTVIGRGVIPWTEILRWLREIEYEGFLAMEYQRGRQSTERLPDPEVGMKEGLVFLKDCLGGGEIEGEKERGRGDARNARNPEVPMEVERKGEGTEVL